MTTVVLGQGAPGASAWPVDTGLTQPTTPADTQPVSGTVAVSSIGGSVAVIGTFFQATQPVSGTVTVNGTVAFSNTTLAVTGPLTDTQLRASAVPVSGTFFQATQPISAAALPLPSGASTGALQTTGNTSLSSIDTKTPALVTGRVPVDGSGVTQPVLETSGTFAYLAGTLTSGSVTLTGSLRSLRVYAAAGADASFNISSGNTITIRDGVGFDLSPRSAATNLVVNWVSGAIDYFAEVV